ncbi:hypothetical protein YB2330_002972 [Saitoella coloradoensis]
MHTSLVAALFAATGAFATMDGYGSGYANTDNANPYAGAGANMASGAYAAPAAVMTETSLIDTMAAKTMGMDMMTDTMMMASQTMTMAGGMMTDTMAPAMATPPTATTDMGMTNTAAVAASGATQTILVGGDAGLVYTPSSVMAAPGTTLLFQFLTKNHTLSQSTFAAPCSLGAGMVDSGFRPYNGTGAPSTFAYVVQSTEPTWWYCKQKGHCGMGMVFAVNPTAEKTFEQFKMNAMAQQGASMSMSMSTSAAAMGGNTMTMSVATAAPAPALTTDTAAVAPPAVNTGTVIAGSGSGSAGACECQCACGVFPLPAGAGYGMAAGWGGAVPAPWAGTQVAAAPAAAAMTAAAAPAAAGYKKRAVRY